MTELSFVLGVALGTLVTGFCAMGSYYRGSNTVRKDTRTIERAVRKGVAQGPRQARLLSAPNIDRVRRQAS
jgi:hypothetical protein